jgi:hypothetical protein
MTRGTRPLTYTFRLASPQPDTGGPMVVSLGRADRDGRMRGAVFLRGENGTSSAGVSADIVYDRQSSAPRCFDAEWPPTWSFRRTRYGDGYGLYGLPRQTVAQGATLVLPPVMGNSPPTPCRVDGASVIAGRPVVVVARCGFEDGEVVLGEGSMSERLRPCGDWSRWMSRRGLSWPTATWCDGPSQRTSGGRSPPSCGS